MVSTENVQNNTNNSSLVLFGPFVIAYYGDEFDKEPADNTSYIIKIVLSILMVLAMLISIFGNICTCTVIVQNRSMRTPTNCYLANLAVTDLLISFFIPIDIYIIWLPEFYPLGEVGCRFHFIVLDCLGNCNMLTITAFTIERYIIVTKPFLRQKMMMNSRVFKIVAVIWIVSLMFRLPVIIYIDLLERKKYVFCYFTVAYIPSLLIGIEIFVFFLLPMMIIFGLYMLIAIELKKSKNNVKLRHSPGNVKQNRDKAVKMLAAIAITFFFFWSPYCMLRVMMIYPNFKYDDNYTIWKVANYLCYNGYLATAVNPILYSLMSRKFRQAFKDFLKGRRSLRRQEERRSVLQHLKLDRVETFSTNT